MSWLELIVNTIFGFGLFINGLFFIPQIIRLFRERSSTHLSAITFCGFCGIQISQILYGKLHHLPIMMWGNAFSLLFCGLTTFLLFYYRFSGR
ncbi:MAG: hypothetical protein EBX40_01100 [Gammaproteobacteria bacterium]|nr:hypothetical protein [Gammaproteobacteria bacterium]